MVLLISLPQAAMDAVRAAGPYLNASFKRRHTVDFKADFHGIVAEADTESQRIVLTCVFAVYPDSLAVSEEAEDLLDKSGAIRPLTDEDIVWYIDPIGGTSNSAVSSDYWCISIAVVRGGGLLAGAVYQPTRDFMFHVNETGAYRSGERISVSTVFFAEGIVGTEFPSPRVDDIDVVLCGFGRLLGSARSLRCTGSTALMLTGAAAGSFLATFNVGTKPQDVAAGALLVECASSCSIGRGDEADGLADATTGGSGNDTSGGDADARPVYHRNAWTASNFVAAGTPEAARACLATAGHPDPDAAVAAAWSEPPEDR